MAQSAGEMITVTQPEITSHDGLIKVIAQIDSHPFYVSWRGETPPTAQAAGDAMLCFALIPAMAQGRDLHIDAPVSTRLLYHSQFVQGTLQRWFPDRFQHDIKVTALPDTDGGSTAASSGAGAFFTGGIDSMFTLQQERENLSHAIYVHGFDIKLKDTKHRQLTSVTLRDATEEAGVELIEVETDVRLYTDQFTNWLLDTVGAALAGVGHLLSSQLGRVLIPASNSYEALPFIGTDPLLDPNFQSDQLEIVHHGAEFDRVGKTAALATWPTAQNHLRVCWQNLDGQRNCGRCEKCARTILSLKIVGAYEEFADNFSDPISTEQAIAAKIAPDPGKWYDWQAMHRVAAEKNQHPEVIAGLEKKLFEHKNEQLTRELRPRLKAAIDSDHWQQRWPRFRNKILSSMNESDPAWLEERLKKNLPTLRDALAQELAKDPAGLKKKLRSAIWKKRLGLK